MTGRVPSSIRNNRHKSNALSSLLRLCIHDDIIQLVPALHRHEQSRNHNILFFLLRHRIPIIPIAAHPHVQIPRATRLQLRSVIARIPSREETPLAGTMRQKVLQIGFLRAEASVDGGSSEEIIIGGSIIRRRREVQRGGIDFCAPSHVIRGLVSATFVIASIHWPFRVIPIRSIHIVNGRSGIVVYQTVPRIEGITNNHAGSTQSLGTSCLRLEGTMSPRH
mmetsp:Transcript_12218/g.21973  ORF Transcript_12218/g.21973 Transcript_12218/m.21973 type:complete len:222 (+) Transcript_12218:2071-2736(+)